MKAFALALLLCATAVAKDKTANLEWKTGMLIDQLSEPLCRTHGAFSGGVGAVSTHCGSATYYKVDAGDMIYTLERRTGSGDKLLDVTINAPVKFAVSSKKWYLQDEQGKAREVSLVQKALKTPKSTQ